MVDLGCKIQSVDSIDPERVRILFGDGEKKPDKRSISVTATVTEPHVD